MKPYWMVIGLVAALYGVCVLIWGKWRAPEVTHSLEFMPEAMAVQETGSPKPALLELRRMNILYPEWLRDGDTAQVRLTFEALPGGDVLTELTDANPHYDVFVETSLDMPDLNISPRLTEGQILPAGRTVTFWWTITGVKPGTYTGTVWLRLRFQPKEGGDESTTTLAAPRITIQISRILGLNGQAARWLGGLCLVIGLGIFLFYWRNRDA